MRAPARIFLLDDEELLVAMLARSLRREGYEVLARSDPVGAIEEIRAFAPDLVILDLKLPGTCGLEILAGLLRLGIAAQVVILSSDATADTAVRAMKMGAVDYLTKPFDLDEMKHLLAGILEKARREPDADYVRRVGGAELGPGEIIGTSASLRAAREAAEKLARASVATVLVTGENGTGKELVARYLHQLVQRPGGSDLAPFIGVNCAALPEPLIESELFGHEKGAFTDAHVEKKGVFELASGGTILLDEIGEMALPLQAKLLRVLEERTFRRIGGNRDIPIDATVVATTNRDLDAAIRDGEFRIDLYYRLATFAIHIAPLRERTEDLLALAHHFLGSFATKYGRGDPPRFSAEAERLLLAYPWPGNVRELRNAMERVVVLESGDEVLPEHLPAEVLSFRRPPEPAPLPAGALLPEAGLSLDALEQSLIEQALARARGNKAQAAKLLGMSYEAMRYQAKKLGLGQGGRSADET